MNNQNLKDNVVNLLWTGGWDSTFRVLQLSTLNVKIQPYYVRDKDRDSTENELRTIALLTKDIETLETTTSILMKVIVVDRGDIPPDAEISNAYKTIRDKTFFGSQYVWLAKFAKSVGNIELTIHEDDKAFTVIKRYGAITKVTDGRGEFYKVDTSQSCDEINKIFGNFYFPILNWTKLNMKAYAENHNFMEIMDKTWFCHAPINNKPCGKCHPCIYTIEEGLAYRFDKEALRRYALFRPIYWLKKTQSYRFIQKRYHFLRRKLVG